jgi:2-polyprenyl-3-methyl-5-hydroxy-6-metoxy-1,4-benzoquinol methylase
MTLRMEASRVPERFVPETMREELLAAEHLARYEWAAALAPGRRVLDAGCGTGYGAIRLAEAGAAGVVGVDIAAAVVEAARSADGGAVSFEQADVARLPHADSSFDLVTCFEVIEHVPDPCAVLGELARVLAPGGVLAISSPNAHRYPPGNPHHRREFTTQEFRALLGEAFPSVRLLAQHQWVSSAVLEEGDLGVGAVTVRTVKATSRALGSEAYTVALAGGGALPELPAVAALTGTSEPRRWNEHFHEQQELLTTQADYLARLEGLDEERRDLRRQLVAAETELAELHERLELAQVRAHELAQVREQLSHAEGVMASVWSSASWRSTRPLRAVKARAARVRRA